MKKITIIVEIGVNYYDIANQRSLSNMDAAKLMITKAAEAGADAVKFQSYKAETLASKNSASYWDTNKEPTTSQYELFKKFDLFGEKEYEELAEYTKQQGIVFLSTPFDFESVDYLDKLVPLYKVASADITNLPLLKKIAEKGKPMLLSTGASTIKEIGEAINFIKNINQNINITLLHCVLSYPTKIEDANLNKISILKEKFPNYEIGYSDHTIPDKNMIITTAAYVLGANIIEKHFTLDKNLKGNDHYHAMDPEDLTKLKENIDLLKKALSKNNPDYLECEIESRKQARRSIVTKKVIKKGEIITIDNITFKRPGTGISPKELDKLINKKANKDLEEDCILKFEYLE